MSTTDPYKKAFGTQARSYEEDQPGAPRGPMGPQAPMRPLSAHMEVFVIYRPLMTCVFCERRLFSSEDEDEKRETTDLIPDNNEEYICPHTRLKDLQRLMARASAGEVVIGTSVPNTLVNGVTQVLVSWVVPPPKR